MRGPARGGKFSTAAGGSRYSGIIAHRIKGARARVRGFGASGGFALVVTGIPGLIYQGTHEYRFDSLRDFFSRLVSRHDLFDFTLGFAAGFF